MSLFSMYLSPILSTVLTPLQISHSSSLGPTLCLLLGHFSLGSLPPGPGGPALIGPGSHEAAVMLSSGFSLAALLGPTSWTLVLSCLDLLPCFAGEHFLGFFFVAVVF